MWYISQNRKANIFVQTQFDVTVITSNKEKDKHFLYYTNKYLDNKFIYWIIYFFFTFPQLLLDQTFCLCYKHESLRLNSSCPRTEIVGSCRKLRSIVGLIPDWRPSIPSSSWFWFYWRNCLLNYSRYIICQHYTIKCTHSIQCRVKYTYIVYCLFLKK